MNMRTGSARSELKGMNMNHAKNITCFRKTANVYGAIFCSSQETTINIEWTNNRESLYAVAERLRKIGFSNENTFEKSCWEKRGEVDLAQIFAILPYAMTADEVKSIFTKYYDQFAEIENRKKLLAELVECDTRAIRQIDNQTYAAQNIKYYVLTENERQDCIRAGIMRNLHRIPKDFTYRECHKFQNLKYETEIMRWIEQSKHDFVLGMLFQSFNQNDWEIFFTHVIEKFGIAMFLSAEGQEYKRDRYFICKVNGNCDSIVTC